MRKICFISIIILAFTLRFYQLGTNPPSLDWDEASLGYNAYSLWKTGRDEYGKLLPINLTSFGDFKPAAYVYLTIPSVAVFGLNEFAVRLPSAIIGTLTVLLVYLLVQELFRGQELPIISYSSSSVYLAKHYFSLLASLFLAISPWHLQFSRVAFEANLGLFWLILGVCLFLLVRRRSHLLIFSLLSFTFSLYSYHSTRLFVPLFLLGLFWYCRHSLAQFKRQLFISLVLAIFIFLPLIYSLAIQNTAARFQAVSQLKPDLSLLSEIKRQEFDRQRRDRLGVLLHNRRVTYAKAVIAGYLDHFDPNFLFLKGDQYIRHNAKGMGLLYLWSLPFILMGIYGLFSMTSLPRFIILWWFFLAPVASSLTKGTPHAVRAMLFLPTYQLFTALGLLVFLKNFGSYFHKYWEYVASSVASTSILYHISEKKAYFTALVIIMLFFVISFFYYLNIYFIHTPIETSQAWQYGYKQVVQEIKKRQNQYSRIIITNAYDQPYIYFLFYLPVDPFWYQSNWHGEISREFRTFGKYEFREINWQQDKNLEDTLLIIAPKDVEAVSNQLSPIKNIYFKDGSVAFYLVET